MRTLTSLGRFMRENANFKQSLVENLWRSVAVLRVKNTTGSFRTVEILFYAYDYPHAVARLKSKFDTYNLDCLAYDLYCLNSIEYITKNFCKSEIK